LDKAGRFGEGKAFASVGNPTPNRSARSVITVVRRFPNCASVLPAHRWIFQNIFSVNLCVLFCRTAAEVLDEIVKLFGRNYVINGTVRYFYRPRVAVNREGLGTAAVVATQTPRHTQWCIIV